MTDFFTPYCKSHRFDTISAGFSCGLAGFPLVIFRLFLGFWLSVCLALSAATTQAAEGIELLNAAIEASDDGYRLSSRFNVELTHSLEDALLRGVPLYFTLQVELSRPRWYWFDEVAVTASRTIRLSYNVLTQQYRASIDGNLHRNFARLDDMMALLRRPGRWLIAEPSSLKKDANYSVGVQLALDVSQLPKPIQVSAIGSAEWRIASEWARFNYRPDGK
jgi:hypothetical protein